MDSERFNSLENRFNKQDEILGNIRDDVSAIKAKLYNGINDDVKELKVWRQSVDKWKWKLAGALSLISVILGLVAQPILSPIAAKILGKTSAVPPIIQSQK